MNPHSFPRPQPISSETDLPEGFGGQRLVASETFSVPGSETVLDVKTVYTFAGQGCRIDQILHHTELGPDDLFWGMVAVELLANRDRLSYVLSPEFVAHLQIPKKKPSSEA